MKKLVSESLESFIKESEFKRGEDPKTALGVGAIKKIEKFISDVNNVNSQWDLKIKYINEKEQVAILSFDGPEYGQGNSYIKGTIGYPFGGGEDDEIELVYQPMYGNDKMGYENEYYTDEEGFLEFIVSAELDEIVSNAYDEEYGSFSDRYDDDW